ncbi:hypothetical protein FTO74_14315 [Granulicella sp. WH15]|uniref:hypothetical protein n=1 Tax=Granulicella sp. WH15 TaxID=2602070 RepID=UPI0013669E7F|nr:hypothetical protein [Granulicella sp. WH15]QHN04406.1 hypothetical protein FTO74_14315 [Granulicella sp. WH15]
MEKAFKVFADADNNGRDAHTYPTHLLCVESYKSVETAENGHDRVLVDYQEYLTECHSLEQAQDLMICNVSGHNSRGRFAVVMIRDLANATKRDGEWFDAPALRLFDKPLSCVKGFPPLAS